MNNSAPTSDTSRTAQRVATWRKEVDAFFGGEWPRLRELIMQLEEQHWEDTSAPPASVMPSGSSMPVESAAEANTDESLPSGDRLSDIAWEIERRLCTNRPGRK